MQGFLKEHPNAQMQVVLVDANSLSTYSEQILTQCGTMLPSADYYRVTINDPDTNLILTTWVKKDTQDVVCAYKKGNPGVASGAQAIATQQTAVTPQQTATTQTITSQTTQSTTSQSASSQTTQQVPVPAQTQPVQVPQTQPMVYGSQTDNPALPWVENDGVCSNGEPTTTDCNITKNGHTYSLFWQAKGDIPLDWSNNYTNVNHFRYFNPRLFIDGKDGVPANDAASASEWCKMVPHKNYTSGASFLNWADPLGDRVHFDGTNWVIISNSDYPRYYECYGNTQPVEVVVPIDVNTPVVVPIDTNIPDMNSWIDDTNSVVPDNNVPIEDNNSQDLNE